MAQQGPPVDGTLRLGTRSFPPGTYAVMAIVNRTPDSFYDRGATFALAAALDHAAAQVEAGEREALAPFERQSARGPVRLQAARPTVKQAEGGTQRAEAALDAGATRGVLGIGGSASTDGGAGLAAAPGGRFLDAGGRLAPLSDDIVDLVPQGDAAAARAVIDLVAIIRRPD